MFFDDFSNNVYVIVSILFFISIVCCWKLKLGEIFVYSNSKIKIVWYGDNIWVVLGLFINV